MHVPLTDSLTPFAWLLSSNAPQPRSKFAKAYEQGIHKSKYWEPYYEDSMDLIAKLPQVAAMVYRNTYHRRQYINPHPTLDWAANLSWMMGGCRGVGFRVSCVWGGCGAVG